MKNSLTVLIILVCSIGLKAQIGKGRTMVGGNINYSQNSGSTDATPTSGASSNSYSNFNIGARCGYFVMNNLMTGILLNSNVSNYEWESHGIPGGTYLQTNLQDTKTNSAGIFGRYYSMLGKSKFAVFAQLDVRYGLGNSENKTEEYQNGVLINTYNQSKSETKQFSSTIALGLTYFVTRNIAIESYFGNIGYTYSSSTTFTENQPNKESSTAGFNTNLNFNLANIFLGINFYFGGKSSEGNDAK